MIPIQKQRYLLKFHVFTISVLPVSLIPATVMAQDTGWQGQITPYVWAAGMGGNITPFSGAPTLSIDRSFSKILKDLDGAFFLNALARKERFVVTGDLLYASLSRKGSIFPGVSASGKLKMSALTLTGGYRAISDPLVTLDVLAGARLWQVRGSVNVPLLGEHKSSKKTFADPIVALRTKFSLDPRWTIITYGDIGGFGAGSEKTKQFILSINYKIDKNIHISTGYRHLDLDYRHKGMHIDTRLTGPFIGLTWQF